MKEERKLVKINENDYKLSIKNDENRTYQEVYYDKEQMRKNYSDVQLAHDQTIQALTAGKKNMKANKVELSDEEQRILNLMEKATKRAEYNKLKEQVEVQEKELELYKTQLKEIETVIPEFKR